MEDRMNANYKSMVAIDNITTGNTKKPEIKRGESLPQWFIDEIGEKNLEVLFLKGNIGEAKDIKKKEETEKKHAEMAADMRKVKRETTYKE
jgi:hypothetical protein